MTVEFEERKGRGIRWQMLCKGGSEVVSGYTIDNLDTKEASEASGLFEHIFVKTRKTLEQRESLCLDSERERLEVCQILSRELSRYLTKERFNAITGA